MTYRTLMLRLGMFLYLGSLLLFMAGTYLFRGLPRALTLLFLQLLVVLPALIAAPLVRRPSMGRLLGFKAPAPRDLLLTLGLAFFTMPLIQLLSSLVLTVLPDSGTYLQHLEHSFSPDGLGVVAWQAWLLVALLPALCEEIMFRGMLLGSLRRSGLGRMKAVLFSAVLFGMFHLDPYRLLPTVLLGTMMGAVVAVSGSLWTGVLYHFVNNSLVFFLSRQVAEAGRSQAWRAIEDPAFLAWTAVSSVVALLLFNRMLKRPATIDRP